MSRLRPLLLIVALALIVAACGDDDSGLLGDAPTANTEAGLPFGGGGSDEIPNTLPETIGNVPGVSGECEALLNLSLAMANAFTGGGGDIDPGFVSGLPPGLQADGALVVGALQQFSQGVQDLGVDLSDPANFAALSEEQFAALDALNDQIFDEEVDAALDRISDAAEVSCSVPGG
jgi:hypothetical protein